MKEFHDIAWYVKRISKEMPEDIRKPVPQRLLGGLAYIIVIIGCMIAMKQLNMNVIASLLFSIILGFSFAAMGFLGHEILHGTVVRKPWLRNLLGGIAFAPLSVSARLWIKWHNITHHAHTQDVERDPDAWISLEQLSKSPKIVRWVYTLPLNFRAFVSFLSLTFTFSMHTMRMFFTYISEFKSKKLGVWLQMLVPWGVWIGLLTYVGFNKWMFMYLIPLLIGNFIVMAYISTNHRLNPLVPVNDPLANSLSVTVPKWIDVLHFNFSYHVEHHMFPGINPKYYPIVKEKILEFWPERYFQMSLVKALVTLWKTPRIYYNETEFLDPKNKNSYKSLGNGLDIKNITYRKAKVNIN